MKPEQLTSIEFHPFSLKPLHELLGLVSPPFLPPDPLRQLRYIEDHVGALGCQTIILEPHYIDRHYIEDHSIFYSRNFASLENFCRRLHFFRLGETQVKERLHSILQAGRLRGRSAYKSACAEFSEEAYLGFCVIKPLAGSPIGRTVLRYYNIEAEGTLKRAFSSTRRYKAHVAGCELKVWGLAFQQQDVGVSACATTALWSSLQQSRLFEEARPATPAQITMLASQHALPTGKPMPSEGLSVDQMCQATQALGIPPNLIRVKDNFNDARAHLHSATLSGFAPVVIMRRVGDPDTNHAVTVTGIKLDSAFDPNLLPIPAVDQSNELKAVYIHDDRVGPYIRANVYENAKNLFFNIEYKGPYRTEDWMLTHILVPMHSKVRFSFAGLRLMALKLVTECVKEIKNYLSPDLGSSITDLPKVVYETKILRSIEYIESLIYGSDKITDEKFQDFINKTILSRYIGMIRISSALFGFIDLIVDTTSTVNNINFLGIIVRSESNPATVHIGEWLSRECRCTAVL